MAGSRPGESARRIASADVGASAPDPGCDRIIFPVSKSSPLNHLKRAIPQAQCCRHDPWLARGIPDSTSELLDADRKFAGAAG